MKKLFLFSLPLLLVLSTIRGQTITQTPGVPHTTSTPTGAPSPLTKASWLRFDKTNKIFYRWTGSAWTSSFPGILSAGSVTNTELASGTGGIYKGSGTVPSSTVATATNGFSLNSGASGQLLFGDYGGAGLGTNLNLQGSGAILGSASYQFRTQADDAYIQMASPGYTIRLEPTTAYTLIQSTATNGYKFWDTRASPEGVEYSGDYSATYTDRSLVDFGSVKALVSDSLATAGDGIYDGSGTVPSGTVASGSAFALRSIVPVDGFVAALRFDTIHSFSTGNLARNSGLSVAGKASFSAVGGAFVNVYSEDVAVAIGAQESDLSGAQLYLSSSGGVYSDATVDGLGLRYAADYSTTIAANDRSIPDVGTVKTFVLGSPSASGSTSTATLNFPSTAAGASSDLTITVTGAVDGNPVALGVPNGSTLANGVFTAWVSAADTVKVRFTNTNLVTALDPASGTFRATVIRY